jgi:hypothetical protein
MLFSLISRDFHTITRSNFTRLHSVEMMLLSLFQDDLVQSLFTLVSYDYTLVISHDFQIQRIPADMALRLQKSGFGIRNQELGSANFVPGALLRFKSRVGFEPDCRAPGKKLAKPNS